ncbi:MAG: DUF1573 domain-containing protein [Isosphaerales bacterium]
MLRWIVLAAVVVGLTAAATFMIQYGPDSDTRGSSAVVESTGPQPKVEIDKPLIHDFGAMSQQSNSTHAWEIKNVGEGVLDLWQESSTCSCTVAKLATKREGGEVEKKVVKVKPGDSTKIDLEWQTNNAKSEDYFQSATIGTNDPSRSSFSLSVKGKVYPPVVIFPPEMITLNGISNEEVTRTRIAVFSMDRPEIKIEKVSTSRPAFIVATPERLSESDCVQLKVTKGYRVDVEVKPGMPLGNFEDVLVIETDHPLRPVVKVSIAGRTTGPISVLPERLRMSNVISSQGATQNMTLIVRGGKPTKFEVTQKPAKVKIEIKPNPTPSQQGRYLLTATVPKGTAAGHIEEEIIIKTDHPRASELKIPVTILISNTDAG